MADEVLESLAEVRRVMESDDGALEACRALEDAFEPYASAAYKNKMESKIRLKAKKGIVPEEIDKSSEAGNASTPPLRESNRNIRRRLAKKDSAAETEVAKSERPKRSRNVDPVEGNTKLTPASSKRSDKIDTSLKTLDDDKSKTSAADGSPKKTTRNKNIVNVKNLKLSPSIDVKSMFVKEPKVKLQDKKVDDHLKRSSNENLSSSFNKSMKFSIEKRNRKGETLLHSACVSSDSIKAKELLSSGANPNTKDHAGWTPLHEVVSNGSILIVQMLLENGARPDIPGPGNETPLHEAVKIKSKDIANLLVEKGANVRARNSAGVTPYDLADDEMKSVLAKVPNVLNTNEDVPLPIFHQELNFEIRVFASNLSKNLMIQLKMLTKHHSIIVEDKISENTTFVLVNGIDGNGCRTDYDTLSAVLSGVPIVEAKWLEKCDESRLSTLKDFEITNLGGYRNSARLSLVNRTKLFPRLFDGCHFYILGLKAKYEISSSLTVNRELLGNLIRMGGGTLLKREPDPEAIPPNERVLPYHVSDESALSRCSHYIIYRIMPELAYNMKHLKTLPVAWLIESIQNFTLAEP